LLFPCHGKLPQRGTHGNPGVFNQFEDINPIARDLLPYWLTFHAVLSPKPWKLEAVLRLFMRLFICMCFGWVILALIYAKPRSSHDQAKLFGMAALAAIFLAGAVYLLRKAWNAQNFFSSGLAALMVFYAGLVLAMYVQHLAGSLPKQPSVTQMVIAMLAFQGAVPVLITFFLKEQGSSWRQSFGLSNDTGRAILIGLFAACLFIPLGFVLQQLSVTVLQLFSHAKPVEQEVVDTIRATSGTWQRIVFGVMTMILAPLGEEPLFRGLIYSTLKQAGFPRVALLLSSFAFAIVHFNAAAFVPLLALAILLAIIYEKTDNLLAPITAHFAFNAIEFTYMLLMPKPV
jgi:membrane protease YdiL (CAAX protease family)